MKYTFLILILVLIRNPLQSQELECACGNAELAEENLYKCEYQYFENGSRLYWQWNCDSAWLTFEGKETVILKSCESETVYECDRLGLGFLKEYPNYLLFQYRWTSGCCTSPDIVFLDKETGKEISRVLQDQFVWGDIDKDFLLYFSDTSFTSLVMLIPMTDRKQQIEFEPGQIVELMRDSNALRLTDLFENIEKTENALIFDLKLKNGKFARKRFGIK